MEMSMKIFCSEEIRELEARAEESGISMGSLMENAGHAVAAEVKKRCDPVKGKKVLVLCGKGNNGGDGFVCAADLALADMTVKVLLVQGKPFTELANAAFFKMPTEIEVYSADEFCKEQHELFADVDVIVDAVFGVGFRGELSGNAKELMLLANEKECVKIACDLPSGANCDTGAVSEGTFRAQATVTFTGAKPANVSYPAKEFCGEINAVQVGIPKELLKKTETRYFEADDSYVKSNLNRPSVQSNKGSLGKLLLVCGSYGMTGACVMAARAALRSGVGLLNLAVEEKIYPIVAKAVPEAIFTIYNENDEAKIRKKLLEALESSTACLIGCGLGDLSEALCPVIFENCTVPLVVDADALNFMSRYRNATIKAPFVLTPHPGEMARLCGKSISEIQGNRLSYAGEEAQKRGCVLVLKGAATVVAEESGKGCVNPTGNEGMAKGGSGDVLAGIIASFAAQRIPLFEAAVMGVYLHGKTGDLCAEKFSKRAMLPTDLIDMLPCAFRLLE